MAVSIKIASNSHVIAPLSHIHIDAVLQCERKCVDQEKYWMNKRCTECGGVWRFEEIFCFCSNKSDDQMSIIQLYQLKHLSANFIDDHFHRSEVGSLVLLSLISLSCRSLSLSLSLSFLPPLYHIIFNMLPKFTRLLRFHP